MPVIYRVPPGGGEQVEVILSSTIDPMRFDRFCFDPSSFTARRREITRKPPVENKLTGFSSDVLAKILSFHHGEKEKEELFPKKIGFNRFEHVYEKVRYRLIQEAEARKILSEKLGTSDDSSALADAIIKAFSEGGSCYYPDGYHEGMPYSPAAFALLFVVNSRLTSVIKDVLQNEVVRSVVLEFLLNEINMRECSAESRTFLVNIVDEVLSTDSEYVGMILCWAACNDIKPVVAKILSDADLVSQLPAAGDYSLGANLVFAAEEGFADIVEEFLKRDEILTQIPIMSGGPYDSLEDAAVAATFSNHLHITKKILLCEAYLSDMPEEGNELALAVLSNDNERAFELLSERAFLDSIPVMTGKNSLYAALICAALLGNTGVVEKILSRPDLVDRFINATVVAEAFKIAIFSDASRRLLSMPEMIDLLPSRGRLSLGGMVHSAIRLERTDVATAILSRHELRPLIPVATPQRGCLEEAFRCVITGFARRYIGNAQYFLSGILLEAAYYNNAEVINMILSREGIISDLVPSDGFYSLAKCFDCAISYSNFEAVKAFLSSPEAFHAILEDSALVELFKTTLRKANILDHNKRRQTLEIIDLFLSKTEFIDVFCRCRGSEAITAAPYLLETAVKTGAAKIVKQILSSEQIMSWLVQQPSGFLSLRRSLAIAKEQGFSEIEAMIHEYLDTYTSE